MQKKGAIRKKTAVAARTKRVRNGSVPELSLAQIRARAERLAKSILKTTSQKAFRRLARGELDGTMVGVELSMIRNILLHS